MAASVTVAVSPVRPGHAIAVEYRVNGGPVRQAIGLLRAARSRCKRAYVSGGPAWAIRRAGRVPAGAAFRRPADLPDSRKWPSVSGIRWAAAGYRSRPRPSSRHAGAEPAGELRWAWNTRFLWSATIIIRKEVVGELPDGLRINW